MGEAGRRGTYEERRRAAIKRDKEMLLKKFGGVDERFVAAMEAGLKPFLERLTEDGWRDRRTQVLEHLRSRPEVQELENAQPVRVQVDEIGWYLFLCEQTLKDPMCVDVSQQQRILPFFVAIGERWKYAPSVKGMEQKIDELLTKFKSNPDGLIFEILVALAYAEHGWDVELLEETPLSKTPDMVVRKDGRELYVECKRQSRRAAYSEVERKDFLRLWDACVEVLVENKQWVWLKGVFHVETSSLPTNFLAEILQGSLPLENGEKVIYDKTEATIHARLIDQRVVQHHMDQYKVKINSPSLSSLLGGDWAPMNSAVTIAHAVKVSHVIDCEVPVLGTYIDEIGWACGFTREYDSEISIDKKARDVTNLLSKAVKQVPGDKPSIIYVAAETLEGKDVERVRTEKVMKTIPLFVTEKPVIAVRFHRFLSNQRTNKLFEFDETLEKFQIDGAVLDDIPSGVVVPSDTEIVKGSHWEVYQ